MSSHSDDTSRAARRGDCDERVIDNDAVSRVRAELDAGGDIDRMSGVLACLADPTRLRLIHALIVEPLCVCDLSEIVGVSQSGVSHQLRVLRELGLVTFERQGRRAVYAIDNDHVRGLLSTLSKHAHEWAMDDE